MKMARFSTFLLFFFSSLLISILGELSNDLPSFNIIPKSITLSGLGAGGYFAGQIQIAHSSAILGAAILNAGPYLCAQGNELGQKNCLKANYSIDTLLDETHVYAFDCAIDKLDQFAGSKTFLFQGDKDEINSPKNLDLTKKFYQDLYPAEALPNLKTLSFPRSGHCYPTDISDVSAACDTNSSPFLCNCGVDLNKNFLTFFYGPLNSKAKTWDASSLYLFDQNPYSCTKNAVDVGLESNGYIYIPNGCLRGNPCKLHISFHDCNQTGMDFVIKSGLLPWAQSNNIISVFPQVRASPNNTACWDWFGYTGPQYATKFGTQVQFIYTLFDTLSWGRCETPLFATNGTLVNIIFSGMVPGPLNPECDACKNATSP